ncbi:MAG: hypothetical protein HY015_00150 [Bacteroidetes bacterium]|nr:hypothetical protein [Bacteroidota bacterium]
MGVLGLMVIVSLPFLINHEVITLQELKDMVLGEALNDGKSMYAQVVDDTPWLASQFAKWIELIFGRSLISRHVLALLILFFQAAFFSFVLIRNKAYNENNYFPALIFGVLCFFSFDLLSLSDELWASTFLLFALNNLFKEIEFRVQRDEIILNLGVYLGIASMFVFSYSIFLIGAYVILLSYTRIDLRKSLLLLFGFLFPHSLLVMFYYFKGGLSELGGFFYGANFTINSTVLISWQSLFWLGLTVLIYFFFSMVMLSREARFTRYQSQLLQVMLIWLLIALLNVFIARERTPHSFITFLPSVAYFISHYLLLIRRKWIAEAMLWIFIIGIIGISFAAKEKKMTGIDYTNMYVENSDQKTAIKDKRILVLSNNIGLYENNKMASYFLNWNLSVKIFELHDYFKDLVWINESFQKDPPDIIVDEKNKMKEIFSRLPLTGKHYQRNGVLYERKKVIQE